jgi:hypothetical protein
MTKKAPAKKAPAKRKPRAKKPVVPAVEPLSEDAKARVLEALWNNTHPPIPAWLASGLKALLLIAVGIAAGIWLAGGIDVSPSPLPADAVSAVYDTQEAAFRRLSGERAKALRAGELASEKASSDWMAAKYLPESDAAWATLLTSEAAAFGGEQWTAEKEAAAVGGYVR